MRIVVASCSLVLLVACGGSAPPAESAASESTWQGTPASAHVDEKLPANTLRRSEVRRVIAAGFPTFLQVVMLDDQPVFVGNKFHGFRIAAMANAPFWHGVDLRPGDVVTSVNGMPIEHPEEAFAAFRALETASELRVSSDRDGVARELRYAIVDDETSRTGANAPRTQVH
jgi:S1-C subfamily serine protease